MQEEEEAWSQFKGWRVVAEEVLKTETEESLESSKKKNKKNSQASSEQLEMEAGKQAQQRLQQATGH